ncbi:hypothetical protein LSH36_626g05027 [Paralvinella palmiformis]|uniref:Uncharacterized protein n=1 Tax=Paralvinella palmiformis TaxID=53620 RepID=A0AAD9MW90_9ANNE|nr:hypothetical protein LSH36_626g05027 [Paralvinella palmiformis]
MFYSPIRCTCRQSDSSAIRNGMMKSYRYVVALLRVNAEKSVHTDNDDEEDEDDDVFVVIVVVSSSLQTMSPANGHMSHSGPIPTGDNCLSPSDDPNILMYPNSLAKASSSPSIATDQHHDNKEVLSSDFQDQNRTSSHQNGEEDVDEDIGSKPECPRTQGTRGSLLEHVEAVMAADEEEDQPKIEKKRKSSVFSKLGSYRQKNKVVKDTKLLRNNTHQFVGVCFSNSTPCDVCSKSMSNKLALQCENCMVNVHENSCKDQIATCAKYRANRVGNGDGVKEKKSSSLPAEYVNNSVNLKSSQSFKETRRSISVPAHPVPQNSGSLHVPAQRASSPSPVINEERDKSKDEEPSQSSPHYLDASTTIADSMSASTDSLEEGSGLLADIDEDYVEEREAWSVTVDKKASYFLIYITLKKMSAKDIKRQDHIWELIQTERSHCHTLKIMQRVFSHGMRHEVNMRQDQIDKIFPCLSELFDIHTTFLHRLMERQSLRADRNIEEIGDILLQQFDGEMGERMKVAYGAFCSQHSMAVQLYKDVLKCDKKFQTFIKKCSQSSVCKRLSIPECILLVTQRVTKYPLLIEPIIKTTKENKSDKERLLRALPLMRQILVYIDARVDAHEKYQRLLEIYNKLDARSYAMYMGKKFKKSNLLLGDRKLMHEGNMRWMTARGKSFEVLAVILSDVMFFLAENNQKLTFFSQDSKSSVVPLSKLLVREKGDTKDSKGIYLICQSKIEPEMYEFICKTVDERKTWIKVIRSGVLKCMEVEGMDISKVLDVEGEKKELEAKSARIRQLVDRLYERDNIIKQKCDEKMNIIIEMLEVFSKEEISKNLHNVYKEEAADSIDHNVWSVLKLAVQDGSRLLSLLMLGNSELSKARAAGQMERNVCVAALPRRAETFSGFDQKEKVKRRYDCDQLSDGNRSGSQLSLNETESTSQTTETSQNDRHSKVLLKLIDWCGV